MEINRLKAELPAVFNQLCHEIQINDTVIDWIDIVFEQVGNASKCPPHSHTWFEFNYVLTGQMQTRFDNQLVTINEGDFFLIPPGLIHSHTYKNYNPHEGICIRWRIRHSEQSHNNDALFINLDKLHQWRPGGYPDHYGIKAIVLHFFQEALAGNSPLSLQLILVRLLEALIQINNREENTSPEYSGPRDMLIKKIEVYLEDYMGEQFNVTELAASLHMSYGHLCRIYKQRTGITLVDRMNRIRLEKARKLLQPPSALLIKEIAEQAGFPDIYYFSKAFKKHYGLSPVAYRKEHTDGN
ncbi:helix-turn-helix transcriptional regulator [Cohnella abietis]|uniref:HTH araC/xylS-type domain-containing protein n=1 Tax=Cohnella abietis TaxID=2507935 RepID=A0A3T1DAR3_9BACL|nr:helix-turn-helix domain-containing protein [Cohnella abietis]BBI35197.1 hypothetical protein KCTCHS21_45960 [Cohnella abietis]